MISTQDPVLVTAGQNLVLPGNYTGDHVTCTLFHGNTPFQTTQGGLIAARPLAEPPTPASVSCTVPRPYVTSTGRAIPSCLPVSTVCLDQRVHARASVRFRSRELLTPLLLRTT